MDCWQIFVFNLQNTFENLEDIVHLQNQKYAQQYRIKFQVF